MKVRMAMLVAVCATALAAIVGPASAGAGAATSKSVAFSSLGQTVPVSGGAAGATFRGTYRISRFAVQDGALVAIGRLKGVVTNGAQTVSASKVVTMPATFGTGGASSRKAPPVRSCTILTLVLGPVDLNVLGLRVQLNQVVLRITAVPGPNNLLGNLLCSLTGLLPPTPPIIIPPIHWP